jgi:hypothetical protein
MTTFSRKKIRGFKRKLRQLDEWKNYIISCPAEYLTRTSGQIFRIHLSPFYWYRERNPHLKFHKHLYQAYFEILQKLKENEVVKSNNLTVQLWLFYPHTVKSLVIVADHEYYQARNASIKSLPTKKRPPKLFNNYFDSLKLKLANHMVAEPVYKIESNKEWVTHRIGDIWTVE